MLATRFRARRRVRNRGLSGKLASCAISLSVKSMQSLSLAAPKFSICGILCPTNYTKDCINEALLA